MRTSRPLFSTCLLLIALVLANIQTPSVNAAQQGDGIIVYGEGTVTTPRIREWTNASSSFGSESSIQATAASVRHVIVKSSPTAMENVTGIQTTDGNLYIQRWNGTSWSSEWNVTVGDGNLPRFDIAYEQTSGEVLVVYGANVATTNELRYRTYNGSSWSAEQNFDAIRTSGTIQAVALEPRGSSDEIGLAWADSNFYLSTNYWDGGSNIWKTEPSAALATNLSKDGSFSVMTSWSFDLAFESLSGELMVVWGVEATQDPFYVMRGAGVSGTWGSTISVSALSEEPTDLEISSDPNSDYIAYVNSTDTGGDADACIWNGSSWTPCSNFDTSVDTVGAGTTNNSINWVSSGSETRAVLTYDDANSSGVDWTYYNKNTNTWAANQTDYTGSPAPASVDDKMHRLRSNPFDRSQLMLLVVDANGDLFTKKLSFDGTNLTWSSVEGGAALETSVSSTTGMAVADFAFYRYIPSGSLSIDIVDGSGASVASPSVSMDNLSLAIDCQTSTGIFGTSTQKIRVANSTGSSAWSLSVAASGGTTALWSAGTPKYDFNDPSGSPPGCSAGLDSDTYAGLLSIDPAVGTVAPQSGCTTTGVSKGSGSNFNEGTTDNITLMSASGSAETGCYWDLTGVALSQAIPAETDAGTYSIDLTLTVVAL